MVTRNIHPGLTYRGRSIETELSVTHFAQARLALALATGVLGVIGALRRTPQPPTPRERPAMASSAFGGRHLRSAGGREVVFCHACDSEWYRDEHESLDCPSCHSSFTEIIDSSNDPRAPDISSLSGRFSQPTRGDDSDPDEGDIEEHLYGNPRLRPGEPASPNPNDRDAVLRRFADMIMHDLGGLRAADPTPGTSGRFPPDDRTPPSGVRFQQFGFNAGPIGNGRGFAVSFGSGRPAPPEQPFNFGTYVVPGSAQTLSDGRLIRPIALIPVRGTDPGAPFRMFDDLFGDPWRDSPTQRNRSPPGTTLPPFMGGLTDLLNSIYNPAAAVHGDAVFTQEAMDRIITQLMEQSPQTNAAPPASQSAIEKLEKKKVNDEMLGPEGKAECTICIDDLKKDEEVVVLPCKHWYHGECVVLWLKEHNTCPICRMPIESRNNQTPNTDNPTSPFTNPGNPFNNPTNPFINNNPLSSPHNPNNNNNNNNPATPTSKPSASSPPAYPFPSPPSSATTLQHQPFTTPPPSPPHPPPSTPAENETKTKNTTVTPVAARNARTARENIDRLAAIRNLAGAGQSSTDQTTASATGQGSGVG
ncbi:hypothetical protein N0V88_003157 [Collariella sp. IMI 366227]|nr:hypothetical protein N0V88_003157 [Collariella sp. IMI 366227]